MLSSLAQNWFLKLISLIFALVLWFFVMGERRQEIGLSVPLNLGNIPEGMMIANEVPNLIDVRISGPRTLLMNLSPQDISISVDLKGLEPGITSFKRLDERLNIPSALRVTRLSPSYVDVKLERVKKKSVPVKVAVSGEPPEGYKLVKVSIKPSKVTIEGAESELKNVHQVQTEPVDLTGVKESFTLMVPVAYRGTYTRLIGQAAVEVQVTIKGPPEPEGNLVEKVPAEAAGGAKGSAGKKQDTK
ncbi:CdaR family protein [Geothermobacter hydrogeniphilus]|uniref:YbbR domain pair protein n=1 Tax=Geothermobacter hydrogeniphilus TaxID=1969733 RepID=A0A1X0YD43_9BACT|nr:CdaR family protein [Geothermobacter hydrogeniphilus]ORJ63047.1 YbbR domain pair protein [Geothermobacter hydrogeniphilus]